jgi:hypothetical protein
MGKGSVGLGLESSGKLKPLSELVGELGEWLFRSENRDDPRG